MGDERRDDVAVALEGMRLAFDRARSNPCATVDLIAGLGHAEHILRILDERTRDIHRAIGEIDDNAKVMEDLCGAPRPPQRRDDTEDTIVFADILSERERQDSKWGEQNHPDGTGGAGAAVVCKMLQDIVDGEAADGSSNWLSILAEEVAEAFAETDTAALRGELVQVAAVVVQWIEAIDRRTRDTPEETDK